MTEVTKDELRWPDLFRLGCIIVSIALCYGVYASTEQHWMRLGTLLEGGIPWSSDQFPILLLIVSEYCLVGLTAICCAAFKKGGFRKVKPFNGGTITFLIVGLVLGLLLGLIDQSIRGVIAGLALGLLAAVTLGYGIELQ